VSLTIGVDIGGTKVLGGVVDVDGTVIATARRDTPASDTAATLDRIVDVINELSAAHRIEAVGIGAAGWIDSKRSTVYYAPNLAWRNEPLHDEIAAKVDVPIVVENDGNVAAWAEFQFGAAKHADESMVLITVGTGIGGGIVIGGDLIRGAHGMSGELGHVMAVRDGHPCGCGAKGCLEQYASGNALTRFAQFGAAARPGSAEHLLSLVGGDPHKLTGPVVTRAAMAGDPIAVDAFSQIGYWLGRGLADLAQILDPQILVVGGGVIEAGELLLAPARAAFAEGLPSRAKFPVADIVAASMGNTAGVVGAADLARRR
jgi:glucokinase